MSPERAQLPGTGNIVIIVHESSPVPYLWDARVLRVLGVRTILQVSVPLN